MLGARTTTKPRCGKNFADRDDFTCIGPSTYAIQDTMRRLGCFLPDRHCPLPSEGGCLAARSRKQRRNYRLLPAGNSLRCQAKNPPAVECKLLITKRLIVKSGGVRKVQGIEAGERELPLNSLIGSDSQPEEKSRLTAEEKSWSLWRSTHSLIKFWLHCLAWQLATSHKEIISGTFD